MDSLKQINMQIHQRALALSSEYLRAEVALLAVMDEVDRCRVFIQYGRTSLFQYAVRDLGLSESVSYNLITVMRKSREIPALHEKIAAGEITLSNARKITSVLTVENQAEWLKKASELSQRNLEKEIVKVRPEVLTPERACYVTETRIKLEFGINEQTMADLRRAQDLLSQKISKAVTLEEVVMEMAQYYLQHHDPIEKAKRILKKREDSSKTAAEAATQAAAETREDFKPRRKPDIKSEISSKLNSKFYSKAKNTPSDSEQPEPVARQAQAQAKIKRTPIPAETLHQVHSRDEGQCCFVIDHGHEKGKRCSQSRWIEVHHRIPLSEGGTHALENLVTLCSIHHRWIHEGRVPAQAQPPQTEAKH